MYASKAVQTELEKLKEEARKLSLANVSSTTQYFEFLLTWETTEKIPAEAPGEPSSPSTGYRRARGRYQGRSR